MPIPDGVYDIAFGPVAILLAVIHDVLALGLVSKRVRLFKQQIEGLFAAFLTAHGATMRDLEQAELAKLAK